MSKVFRFITLVLLVMIMLGVVQFIWGDGRDTINDWFNNDDITTEVVTTATETTDSTTVDTSITTAVETTVNT